MGKMFVSDIRFYKKLLCVLGVTLTASILLYSHWYAKTYPDYKQVRNTTEELLAVDFEQVEQIVCANVEPWGQYTLFDTAEAIEAFCAEFQPTEIKRPFLDSGDMTGGSSYAILFQMKDGTVQELRISNHSYNSKTKLFRFYVIFPDPPVNDRGDKVYAEAETIGLRELLSRGSPYEISREEYEKIIS